MECEGAATSAGAVVSSPLESSMRAVAKSDSPFVWPSSTLSGTRCSTSVIETKLSSDPAITQFISSTYLTHVTQSVWCWNFQSCWSRYLRRERGKGKGEREAL